MFQKLAVVFLLQIPQAKAALQSKLTFYSKLQQTDYYRQGFLILKTATLFK